uniref:Phospholipase-like protein n=1 Tax=Tanacetum cinerariifolium TaxID=118510 RepID=A0A6L2LKX3_TANCI|nr:hypothetical protein [Tanacetum cinerariifolium]
MFLLLVEQLEVEGDGNEYVPLYYYITDNIRIQFGREEFCLVTGLRFGVKNLADYNNVEFPIPFRRRVFPSSLDGEHITCNMVFRIIDDELFDRLHDDDVVSLCCLGILQLVLLDVEGRRRIHDWMLRLANDRVDWDNYPSDLDFGVFPLTATKYYNRYNRYPRVAALKKRGSLWEPWFMVFSWKYDCGKIDTRQDRGSIGLGGPSSFQTHPNNISFFNIGTLTNWQTSMLSQPGSSNWQTPMHSQPGSSNWQRQMPAHSATPYWQPAIPSHPGTYNWQSPIPSYMGNSNLQPPFGRHDDVSGLFDQNLLNRGKREQRPSIYKRSPFIEQPPSTVLPKQRGNKTKKNVKKSNLSPLNLGNALDDENERGVPVTLWQQLVPHLCMPDIDSKTLQMKSWMELLIRNRTKNAPWKVAYTNTISVRSKNQRFLIETDQHAIGTLDGSTRPMMLIGCLCPYMLKEIIGSQDYGIQQVRGSPYEAFEILPHYCYNPEQKNEGTVTRIKTEEKGIFEMSFIGIGASIRTFINYLRLVLMIDSAYLKGLYKVKNLAVMTMDGNYQIVPILFALAVKNEFPLAFHAAYDGHHTESSQMYEQYNSQQYDAQHLDDLNMNGLVPLADATQERDMILMYTHHNRIHVYVSRVELSPLVVAEQYKDETNKTDNQEKPSCSKKLFD